MPQPQKNEHPTATLHGAFCRPLLPTLIPQFLIGLFPKLLTVLLVHSPEAEAIHDFSQGVVIVVELNGSHNVEHDL